MQKILWNDIARGGVLIGLVMSGFTVLDITILLSGGADFALMTSISSVVSLILYVILVRYVVLKFVAKLPKQMPFSYMQSLSFISLSSILASVWVGITSNVMITQVVGFDNYIDSYVAALTMMMEGSKDVISSGTKELADTVIESVKSSQQPNIIDSIFGTAFSYIIRALVVGIPLSFWIKRNGTGGAVSEPIDNSKSQGDE